MTSSSSDAAPAAPKAMDCQEARISLGVYVLGAIDPAERALVDAIRRQARHEDTTRWDTIEFKLD